MNIVYDNERLLQLITSLRTLTGIKVNILDVTGKEIGLREDHAPFCRIINACEEGHKRCEECDALAVRKCGADLHHYSYRCHAGVCETLLPIRFGSSLVGYISFGQLLDDSSVEEQWANTERTLGWYSGDVQQLKEAYLKFRQYNAEEIAAILDILEAFSTFIRGEEMIQAAHLTQLQQLEVYLEENYTEKLSLSRIAADLGIGRTKLCLLAKNLSGGKNLSYLIAQKRMEAAKRLLLQENCPISEVAERVGISDYNYFTKIFRSVVGVTPSVFRKNAGRIGEHHR